MKLAQIYKMMKPPTKHSTNATTIVTGPPMKNPQPPPTSARNNVAHPTWVIVIGFFLERGFVPIGNCYC
jgi:hypothetical protein